MTRSIRYVLILFAIGVCSGTVFGQIEDQESGASNDGSSTTWEERWKMGEMDFSPRPKDALEAGVHFGNFMINGDVANRFPGGFGAGFHVRKSINYILSARIDGYYGSYSSWDVTTTNPSVIRSEQFYTDDVDNSQASIDQYLAKGEPFVRNFETKVYGVSLQGLVNVGNVLFHQEQPQWGLYGLLGLGFYGQSTSVNLLDNDNTAYNFSSAFEDMSTSDRSDRKEIRKRVKDLLDDDFETRLEPENDLNLSGHFGFGLSRRINEHLSVSLEHQFIFSDNDQLDGFEYRSIDDLSNNTDWMNYTSVRLNINLGVKKGKTEPLYWMNPQSPVMKDIGELKRRPIFDKTDRDEDGVIDILDSDPNTPKGVPVDTKGIARDSDGDGVPDYQDKERFSPSGYPYDENGVAQVPPGPEYMTEQDVRGIVDESIANINQRDWWMPMIHFDLDQYRIKPDFYGELYQIAQVLQANPSLKVVVRGHADTRASDEYNRVLSYNRALAAADHLVEQYGIDRNRLFLQYKGEELPVVDGSKLQGSDKKKEDYVNRRVEFFVASKQAKSMDRPEGPKAGKGPILSDEKE